MPQWIWPPYQFQWFLMPKGRYLGEHWRVVITLDGEVIWSQAAKTQKAAKRQWFNAYKSVERWLPCRELSGPILPADFPPDGQYLR